MKKLSLVLVALLAFSFAGCEGWLDIPDPEPEPDPDPDPIEETLINLITTDATLHRGETFQIEAECEYPITYTSEDEYYATVSEDGVVTAGFVGSTNIMLEAEGDSQTFTVTIEPTSNLYDEPEIQFGESKDELIERLGTPDEEEEGVIAYANYGENCMLMVTFDEEDLVQYYAVILPAELESEMDIFLGERYQFYTEEDGTKAYINALDVAEATMIIGSQVFEDDETMMSYLMAVYMSIDDDGGEGGGEGSGEEKSKGARFLKLLKRIGK